MHHKNHFDRIFRTRIRGLGEDGWSHGNMILSSTCPMVLARNRSFWFQQKLIKLQMHSQIFSIFFLNKHLMCRSFTSNEDGRFETFLFEFFQLIVTSLTVCCPSTLKFIGFEICSWNPNWKYQRISNQIYTILIAYSNACTLRTRSIRSGFRTWFEMYAY